MQRSEHYLFAHQNLPQKFLKDPADFERQLTSGAWKSLWSSAELQGSRHKLPCGADVFVVKMPPPANPGEAYLMGLILGENPRYITLEKTAPDDEEAASRLGEWQLNSRHGHGIGPEPDPEKFLLAITAILESSQPQLSVDLSDLHVEPAEARKVVTPGSGPLSMTLSRFVSCHTLILSQDTPKSHITKSLALSWWNFRRKREALLNYRLFALILLCWELDIVYPEDWSRISYAGAVSALAWFGVEIFVEERPENHLLLLAYRFSELGKKAQNVEAVADLFLNYQKVCQESISRLELPS